MDKAWQVRLHEGLARRYGIVTGATDTVLGRELGSVLHLSSRSTRIHQALPR